MGNGEAKELICMTHGHQQRWGNDSGGYKVEGKKEEKKWGNCNSIINKIYLKRDISTNCNVWVLCGS